MSRLRAWLVVVTRRDGSRFDAIFYATDALTALSYGKSWARRLGHVSAELAVGTEAV